MYLNNNPLHCDCQLKELWRWCQDHNIRRDSFEGYWVCLTPNLGVVWRVLDEIQCTQVNMSNNVEYKEELDKNPDEEIQTKHQVSILIILATLFFLS